MADELSILYSQAKNTLLLDTLSSARLSTSNAHDPNENKAEDIPYLATMLSGVVDNDDELEVRVHKSKHR